MPQTMVVPESELRSELAHLIARPEKVRAAPGRLWRALTVEERLEAARLLLEKGTGEQRTRIRKSIVELRRIRPKTVQSWPRDRVARTTAELYLKNRFLAYDLLVQLHFGFSDRRAMLVEFLDELGIEHNDGYIEDPASIELAAGSVRRAADRLAARHPLDRVVTYFLTLIALGMPIADELPDWLRDFSARLEPGSAGGEGKAGVDLDEGEDDVVAETQRTEPTAPEDTAGFTTLDRQLVRVIVDVVQGIEGALTRDELDDLIQELLELNGTRHQSYFHAGLRDALFRVGPERQLPARNLPREQWYWAGYIQGLAREGRWDEVVQCFDAEPAVRSLGKTGQGPSDAAAVHIFRALVGAGRHGEVPGFLKPMAVVTSRGLFPLVADTAEELLREDNAAEARALYDLLGEAIEILAERGEDTSTPPYLAVRRRRAHCYRQLGELAHADRLLNELLQEESNPDILAMVLTDLGLIAGGFRRLADLRLPLKEEKLAGFRDALARGEPKFQEVLEIDARYSAHARFCIGVLALTRSAWGEAVDHLEFALSVFEAEPARYSSGGILTSARLCFGLALALDVQVGRMQRAANLISDALKQGERVPEYLIPDLLEAVSLRSGELAHEIADQILSALGPEALDTLSISGVVARSPAIANALLDRGLDRTRSEPMRADDLYRALPILLTNRELDRASEALDALEELAFLGIERDRFISLLEEPVSYSPAWEIDDARQARVRCLEVAGDYEAAARDLTEEFHQVLSRLGTDGVADAEAILERIESYGLPQEFTARLHNRLEALRKGDDRSATEQLDSGDAIPIAVRILYVGGDERQARYDREITEELAISHPKISVEFRHPGWSGNWGGTLEEVLRTAENYDGIVISRLVRTEFGRQLRKGVQIPWRGCGGMGKKGIITSILLAARDARKVMEAKVGGRD